MIPEAVLNEAILLARCMGCSYWWIKSKGGRKEKVMKRAVLALLLRDHGSMPVSMRMLSKLFGMSEGCGPYYYRLAKEKISQKDTAFTALYLKAKLNLDNPDKSHLPEFIDTSRFQRISKAS